MREKLIKGTKVAVATVVPLGIVIYAGWWLWQNHEQVAKKAADFKKRLVKESEREAQRLEEERAHIESVMYLR